MIRSTPDLLPPEPPAPPRRGSSVRRPVERVTVGEGGGRRRTRRDVLATEEPLEIRLVSAAGAMERVAVTMRTPGDDFELAAGFLYGEGIVDSADALAGIGYCVDPELDGPQRYNVVNVRLAPGAALDPGALRRNFYTTSSCGVCGKASIDAVLAPARCAGPVAPTRIRAETLLALPARLRRAQTLFDRTGGLHAAGLFEPSGELLRVREDVGRHNAMDKLVGSALLAGELPLGGRIVLVSGRLSFELVQKAARAGASLLAGVSAPSSLAVELAESAGLALVGFLRETTFNVYTGGDAVLDGAAG